MAVSLTEFPFPTPLLDTATWRERSKTPTAILPVASVPMRYELQEVTLTQINTSWVRCGYFLTKICFFSPHRPLRPYRSAPQKQTQRCTQHLNKKTPGMNAITAIIRVTVTMVMATVITGITSALTLKVLAEVTVTVTTVATVNIRAVAYLRGQII